jgi:hypothetical protein
MSVKSLRIVVAVAVMVALGAASAVQALPSRPSSADREGISVRLLELLPGKVREWIEGRDVRPAAPRQRTPQPLKCGGGIDPNGQPCH